MAPVSHIETMFVPGVTPLFMAKLQRVLFSASETRSLRSEGVVMGGRVLG